MRPPGKPIGNGALSAQHNARKQRKVARRCPLLTLSRPAGMFVEARTLSRACCAPNSRVRARGPQERWSRAHQPAQRGSRRGRSKTRCPKLVIGVTGGRDAHSAAAPNPCQAVRRSLTPTTGVGCHYCRDDQNGFYGDVWQIASSQATGGPSAQRWQLRESAGINRHGEGDENALHRRRSESRWPRVMRWRSVRAQRSVDRGRAGGAIEPRNSNEFRVPTLSHVRKAMLPAALSRVAGGPCAVGDPRHARRAPCARTGRSRGRPLVVDDAPSGMVRGVADQHRSGREGNA